MNGTAGLEGFRWLVSRKTKRPPKSNPVFFIAGKRLTDNVDTRSS